MPQPDYVPLRSVDRVRPTERLPVPEPWTPDRPAEVRSVHQPTGPLFGNAGPDQGFGIKLARHFGSRLRLAENELSEDAVAGALAVGLKRASIFGRAPVVHDFEFAYRLFGFLDGAPPDLIAARRPLFEAASHHYEHQRALADCVPEATLRLTPAQVADRLGEWRSLLQLG